MIDRGGSTKTTNPKTKTVAKPKRQSFRDTWNSVKTWAKKTFTQPIEKTIAPGKSTAQKYQQEYTKRDATRFTDTKIGKTLTTVFTPQPVSKTIERGKYTADRYKNEYTGRTTPRFTDSKVAQTVVNAAKNSQGGGQFSGVAQQAQDLYHQEVDFDRNNLNDWTKMGRRRAKAEAATSFGTQQFLLINAFDDDDHRRMIEQGETWIGAGDDGNKLITDYIYGGVDLSSDDLAFTEEEIQAIEERYAEYEDYINKYYIQRPFYNSETDQFEDHYCIASWAPLPPWIDRTNPENVKEWSYYTGFMAQNGDDLRDQATALYEQREKYKDKPYKSAMNFAGDPNLESDINSLADVITATLGNKDATSAKEKASYFIDTFLQYRRDYSTNPRKAGKYGTLLGNRLWALMDDMDFIARGSRAFLSGTQEIGGTTQKGHTFVGQTDEYYVHFDNVPDSTTEWMQKEFIEHGGYDLLLRRHGYEGTGYRRPDLTTDEELINELEATFDRPVFKKYGITWQDFYDDLENYSGSKWERIKESASRGWENVKKTYADPEATFDPDTGSVVADMVIGTVTDPSFIIGGLSKNVAKTGAREASEFAIRDVAKSIGKLSDSEIDDIFRNKAVRKAIRAFSNVDDGRMVLFRNADDIRREADVLSDILMNQGVLDETSKEAFRRGMSNALAGTKYRLNGQIVGEQVFQKIKNQQKLSRMAAYTDKAIDSIDMAIIKGTFIEPVALSKFFKEGKSIAYTDGIFRNLKEAAQRKADEAAHAVNNAGRTNGVFSQMDELQKITSENRLKNEAIEKELSKIKSQIGTAARQFDDIDLDKLSRTDALNRVDDILAALSGDGDNALKDIDALMRTVKTKYSFAGDFDDVMDVLKRSYDDVVERINRQDISFSRDLFREVRNVRSADDLASVIYKYANKLDMWNLRTGIIDNIVDSKLISESEVDEILEQLSNGLLSERAATLDQVHEAGTAIANTVTESRRVVTDSDVIKETVDRLPNLQQALRDFDNYPYLRKLDTILDKASQGKKYSEEQMLYHITDAHAKIAEATKLGISSNTKAVSDDLLELKHVVEKRIELSGNEVITQMHLDRQVKHDTLIRDSRFTRVFDDLYERAFKPAFDLLDSKRLQGMDAFGNSKIYQSLMKLGDIKYTYNRYRRFIQEIDSLPISDEAKYAVRNGLFGNFGESGKNLTEVTRKPGKIRTWLNAMLYNEFSSSKVGMDTLTARLNTIDNYEPDELIASYVDEIKNNKQLDDWYRGLMQGDSADPQVYLEKQVLATILMDTDSIARYNAHEQAPIFVHLSTTGLSDDAAITGISYFKWKKLEVGEDGKPTIESIYNMLHSDDGVNTIRRSMSDADIDSLDEYFLRSIYKDSIGERQLTLNELRDNYKAVFGATDQNPINTEQDILEAFFTQLYPNTHTGKKQLETVVPTFVVHDLDGFNIPFLNRRAGLYSNQMPNSRTWDYYNRLSGRTQNKAINTFEELRRTVNDHMLSDEEFRQIEESIFRFSEDLSTNTGKEFNMLDIQDVPSEMRSIISELGNSPKTAVDDDVIQLLRSSIDVKEANNMLDSADDVLSDVAVLEDEARQIVSIHTPGPTPIKGINVDPELNQLAYETLYNSNPVKDAAEATGRRVINAEDRYDLHVINKHFSLGNIDEGVKYTFHDISKMSNVAKYVDEKLKYSIRMGAEDYLQPFKPQLDKTIEAIRNLAFSTATTDGYFGWLKCLKVPETATESYLVCQKLYDDLLKYWLNNDLVRDFERYSSFGILSGNLNKGGVRERLLAEFVDNLSFSKLGEDINNFDELLNLFEGSGQSLIFKDVPIEYVSKLDLFTSHGKVKDGVDLARRLKRGYTQMQGIITEEKYLDSLLRSTGIETKTDFARGLMYTHTADLVDIAEEYNLLDDVNVRKALADISSAHVMRFQDARYKRLLDANGTIDDGKLLSELLYNGTNHVVFPKQYLKDADVDEMKRAVKAMQDNGADYIKLSEDRGAIGIYLTDKCEVVRIMEDGREMRFVHKLSDNTYGGRFYKPELEAMPLPTKEELEAFGISEGLDEHFWDFYSKLQECWSDVGTLTEGASNGTLGRVVFERDAEEYYKVANSFMPDLLSSKGMRDAGMYGRTMYDPGFMLTGDYDILTDYLYTMETQAENFKTSGMLINNVFGSGNEFSFGELTKYADADELVDFFGDNSDFVVCSVVPAKDTKTGLRVRQLSMSSAGDVEVAKQLGNTTVLPYDVYLDMVDAINTKAYTTDLNRAINKMMLVYKAGALFHPGTWVRNFIDATQKASTDLGESPINIVPTFFAELRGARDLMTYHQAMKYGDDFLNEANWDMIKYVLNTDMSYEHFELLRGMFDSNRYVSKAQTMLNRKRALSGGREIISGDRVGLNNLPEKDIKKCYTMASRKYNLMEKKRFIELYTGMAEAVDDVELKNYEESLRSISNYMHSSAAVTNFSNAVSASFIPFNAVESTVRYTQLARLNDLGFSNNQALKRVHLTQFRQAERYGIPNKLEYIAPFITFKYNNLKYWMRMMEENPRYFRYFTKLYGNIYEDTVEQYAEKGQQLDFESNWMLKSGGIPIGNGQYYFKINPSFMDALQIVYGFPTELVDSQNPLLRLATRASMYELGLDGKYIFQELNLNPDDINVDLNDILKSVAPRAAQLAELRNLDVTALRTWVDDLGPDMPTLHKLIPSLIGKNYMNDYGSGDFQDYLDALAKDGLWFDANTGQVVDIKYKNETGMNNPDTPWMDLNNYMMQHFNKTWDANAGKFVMFWELSDGGLNQVFDFDNDPDAWDKLCAEWAKKGKKYDYNQRKFIPISEWRPEGLNNPNLTFDEKVELMAEKFPNLKWDANQNTFVESDKVIPGGLNSISSGFEGFKEVCVYRYLLFGEEYDKETKKFNKTSDNVIVKLDKLHGLDRYDKYFAMLGIPSLADTSSRIRLNDDGFLVTSDGKYVLLDDPDYNQKLFRKLAVDYAHVIPTWNRYGGRRYRGWKRYSYTKFQKTPRIRKSYNKARARQITPDFHIPQRFVTGFGWNDQQGYYRLAYKYQYQYHNPQPASKLHCLISPPMVYPYGGGYNKFSFHSRY